MKIKVKFLKKALAAFLSFAMASTIVPEIWLPVHAEMVRNEIIGADIEATDNISESDESADVAAEAEINAETASEDTADVVAFRSQNRSIQDYVLFSGNQNQPLNLNGWKGNFTGNIYSGQDFVTYLSEFFVDGKIDAVGRITAGGWMTEISERNENAETVAMPDFDAIIEENAQPIEYLSGSPAYIQDKTVINGGIKSEGSINISGTYFEGDCYIIAEGDITYNVMSLQTTGRVFLYSKNGNISINGSQIELNGILYAPNGRVTFNTYDTTINGCVWADTISFNGSIFNVRGANFDMVEPKYNGVVKTYTTDADFSEGTLEGTSLNIPNQLILAEKSDGDAVPYEKIYGDAESGKGVKVTYSADKSAVSGTGDNITVSYDLSGFGDADINENAVDLIIVVDESGSMSGAKTTSAKAAAKEVIAQMKENDRCAVVGFTTSATVRQTLTSDKTALNNAVNKIAASGNTSIYRGIDSALSMFDSMSDDGRQKFIILLSDGEDGSTSQSLNSAKTAGSKNIRIFALMIGTGTLQMQNIAINSNGIYKNAPGADDIGKIMSYFASEVFNVAGRNTAFKTTVKNADDVNLAEITPQPTTVTQNGDGSVTLEWSFDRILIDEAQTITMPVSISDVSDGFADILENTSCVYYDREGKPSVIYPEDISFPVSGHAENGSWSVIYDSENENVDWGYIYWNGKRYGDGEISVSASVSSDGINFNEAIPVTNYGELTSFVGRYIKLDVNMALSSDGKSPELFDITVASRENAPDPKENAVPEISIYVKDNVKAGIPVNIRAEISDDCLDSDITAEWSCNDESVVFTNNTGILTSVIFPKEGRYDIVCTVSDGTGTSSAVKTIDVNPADSFGDIDPIENNAPAPSISVNLPAYADRRQVINAKIESLNNTEISWYSVIANGNTAIDVDADGNFKLTMPNSNTTYKVAVRAFDWAGNYDLKEYTIIVNTEVPTVTVTASKAEVEVDEEAYFTASYTLPEKIASVTYTLNGAVVNVDSDNKYILDTSAAGTYEFTVKITTNNNATVTAKSVITVKAPAMPEIGIALDKSVYYEGDNAVITVTVSANVVRKELYLNGELIELDENNQAVIQNLTVGKYLFTAYAYDAKGNTAEAEYELNVEDIKDTEPPVIHITSDKNIYYENDDIILTVTATDNIGVDRIELYVDGVLVELDENGSYTIKNAVLKTYEITAYAFDAAGNRDAMYGGIPVNDNTYPELKLLADKTVLPLGESVEFTVEASDNSGTVYVSLFVGDTELTIENGKAVFTPESAGKYAVKAIATDPAGNKVELTGEITVIIPDLNAPEVRISLDKDTYFENDDIIITVTATDDIGVETIKLYVDGSEVALDENNSYTIKKAEEKVYSVSAAAYDAAGNHGTISGEIPVNPENAPVITAVFDKDSYAEGDDLTVFVSATGQTPIAEITLEVNGVPVSLDENSRYTIENIEKGTYVFDITAADTRGLTSSWQETVEVKEKLAVSELTATIEGIVEYGDTATLKVEISDGIDPSTLKATLDGEEIALSGVLTYDYLANELFEHKFVIMAQTIDGEELSVTAVVNVIDSICPVMTMEFDKPYYNGNEDITAFLEYSDNVAIKRVEFTFDGVEYPIGEDGKVTVPKVSLTTHTVVANAWDTFGNSITLSCAFIVVYDEEAGGNVIVDKEDVDNTSLLGKIYTPTDGQKITAPVTIIGTADGVDFASYKVEYAPVGTTNFTQINRSEIPVNAGTLGRLDPTLLKNGLYVVRLTVYGVDGKTSMAEIVVSVEGSMKIGNFSIAFQDMDVNVAGLPLTVIRSYDSRDRSKSGDFGYGWEMSTAGLTLKESYPINRYWASELVQSGGYGLPQYVVSETKKHIVTINYGNGKTEKFTASVKNDYPQYDPTYGVTLSFAPQNGSKSKLEIIGATGLGMSGGYLIDTSWFDIFEYTQYRLTTQDGTVYLIHKTNGVQSITDPNGNKITFNSNGINHTDGKNIAFNRDSNGRITSIVAQSGLTVSYEYDGNGDLVSVTDVEGYVTRFVYENHYLTEIIDPRGVSVSRNIYDDDGRLIKTIDADGNEIKYDHDIDGREERVTDRNGNVTRFIYDSQGNVLSQTDAMGNTVRNTYNGNGNIASKTDAMGNVTKYNYDANGNMLSMTNSEGNTVNNGYNSKGQLTSVNSMGINAIAIAYDSNGNLLSTKDALGNDINYNYDNKGRVISITDEIGIYMNTTYDSNGNVISATDEAGTTSRFTYDDKGNCLSKTLSYTSETGVKTVTENYVYDNGGNLVKIIDSDGNITTTDYNSMGQISSATDAKGRVTNYDYDVFGNHSKISYPDGTTEAFTYDREGRNLTATDRMGRTVTMAYDKVGNLLSKTYPNGAKVTYSYNANYQLISETSASGGVTSYEYDSAGRNTAIVDALGNRTSFAYNGYSQLESMTDAKGNTYVYSYDLNGNRTKTTYPDGTSVSSVYDARGRVESQTDQHGYITRYEYDGADRLTGVTDTLENTASYAYDEVGNLISVTDADGNSTSYVYDDFGRVVKTVNALGQTAAVSYDISGNILTQTDFGGKLTTFIYDDFDRLSSKTTSDGTVTYTYTTDGKLETVTDSTGVTSFIYDLMGGLSRVTYPDGRYVSYEYDESSRLTEISTEYGATNYEYDVLDRLVRVIDRNGYATVYTYDANGNRSKMTCANGITTSYDYDALNRLIFEETLDKDGNVVAQYIYTLGLSGERTSVTELDRTVEYSYDELYRLTNETVTENGNTTVYTYAYDNVSNRTLKTENGTETVYVYNVLNQLISENDTTYEYDGSGNLVRTVASGESAIYEHNAENKLVRATVQKGNIVTVETYTYDFSGNRISKSTTASNGTTEYVKYLNDINTSLTLVLAELNADDSEKTYYTRGQELISQERDGDISYYLYDGHISVRGLADDRGNLTDTYVYDAWGNLVYSTGDTENKFLYCGEQFDGTTGFYYLRARYMNPSIGTFISMDTYQGSIFEPVSLHKYLYANANPVMYSDPSGNMGLLLTPAFAGGINASEQAENTAWAMGVFKWVKTVLLGLFYTTVAVSAAYVAHHLSQYISEAVDAGSINLSDLGEKIKGMLKTGVLATLLGSKILGLNTVYVVFDPNEPAELGAERTIIYVGRTIDIPTRQSAHNRTPGREFWKLVPVVENLSVDAARVAEQLLISTYSLGSLVNKIRGIAPHKLGQPKFKFSIDVFSAELGVAEDELFEQMRRN